MVRITGNSELSHITVSNGGYIIDDGDIYNAIYVNPRKGAAPTIRHVVAFASPYDDYETSHGRGILIVKNSPRLEHVGTYGKSIGIYNLDSSPSLYRVNSSAGFDDGNEPFAGAGIYNNKSTVEMDRVSGSGYFNIGYGDGLVNTNGSHVNVKNSTLGGWIYNDSSSSATIVNSQLKETVFEGGNFTCLNSYDDYYKPLNDTCR